MAEVRIEGLTKYFGDTCAVNQLNLVVRDGDLVVLLGPSGCGKTTTMRCVAGLERPTYGDIYIGETRVNDLEPRERDVALVFQSYALYPHFTAFDNIAYPLRLRKTPKDEIERRVRDVAEMLGITHTLERPPGLCSGGEQQRIALGRAIVREPVVFLMDEPLSNIDALLRVYMRAEIKRLQHELGTTMIYVTHDQVEGMTMADQIAVMNEGTLQQLGTPSEIYDMPANNFVARFVGSTPMNFIPGALHKENGKTVHKSDQFVIPVSDEMADRAAELCPGGVCTLGVRPEEIRFTMDKDGANQAGVFLLEPLGSETILDIEKEGLLLKVKDVAATQVRVGDVLSLSFNRFHLFDDATGAAIR
ncbi:MAG: ABC transporter ATP-binding protein [Caldilineaceae bacterium]|nr:ABC transporter ATP-binding protein [Caldilineaceae bacterium]